MSANICIFVKGTHEEYSCKAKIKFMITTVHNFGQINLPLWKSFINNIHTLNYSVHDKIRSTLDSLLQEIISFN